MVGWIGDSVGSIKSIQTRRLLTQCVSLGMMVTFALIIWKALICFTGSESPVVVVISESMEPGFKRGDILFLTMSKNPIRTGEIAVYNVEGHEIPIVHRVIEVHERQDTGAVDVLTKGDNNKDDDRMLYARGQQWLHRHHFIGRAVGFLPNVGWVTIVLTEHPAIKVSEDAIVGANQKGQGLWRRVKQIYDQCRIENPTDLSPRNCEQMKCRYKRLTLACGGWIEAYTHASRRKQSGQVESDIVAEAHILYQHAHKKKFLDLHVFEEVMRKHPKWNPGMQKDQSFGFTFSSPANDIESGGSTKRTRTTEEETDTIPDDPPTPISRASTIERPIGREAAKKTRSAKGKEKVTSNNDNFPSELDSLQIARSTAEDTAKYVIEQMKMNDEKRNQRMKEYKEAKTISANAKITSANAKISNAKAKIHQANTAVLQALIARGKELSPDEEAIKNFLLSQLYNKE